jgi:hypothetical protein
MDDDMPARRLGRRAVLAGAAAGAVAAASAAILKPAPVDAANGNAVVLGQTNEATSSTWIVAPNQGTNTRGALLAGPDYGVYGYTKVSGGYGVRATAVGSNTTAVQAETDGASSQVAVRALATPEGIAVNAVTVNGTALRAVAQGGYALDVSGRAVFARSGKVTIGAGKSSKSVTRTGSIGYIGPDTIILATIQGYVAGVWVAGVVRNGDQKFTIRLNKPAPSAIVIGWFLVN